MVEEIDWFVLLPDCGLMVLRIDVTIVVGERLGPRLTMVLKIVVTTGLLLLPPPPVEESEFELAGGTVDD